MKSEDRIKELKVIIASLLILIIMLLIGIAFIHNRIELKQNDIFEFKCETSLDYEFNCQNKFENITGLYCLDKGFPELKCQNQLK